MSRKKAKETPAETPKRTSPTIEFLPVPYTNAQLLEMASRLARTSSERDQTIEQFEVLKTNHRHQVEAMDNSIRDLTRKIGRGHYWENIDCFWILESPTPHEKELVRTDTAEIVRVVPMEKHDFQEVLLPAALQRESLVKSPDPVASDDFKLSPSTKPERDGKAAAANSEKPQ